MTEYLHRETGKLALKRLAGHSPAILFCPGFASDMTGTKAQCLWALAQQTGCACVLFDYAGHGQSGGTFEEGTVGGWAADTLAVMDSVADGQMVLVGSSMGGWIALLAAVARPEKVAALIGVAAAPDFTERLIWERLGEAERRALREQRVLYPAESPPISWRLVEEGREHLLLDAAIPIRCPVRLLHGQADRAVPWEISLAIAGRVTGDDVRVVLVKDGEHRLSRPQDLALLDGLVRPFLGQDGGEAFAVGGIAPGQA